MPSRARCSVNRIEVYWTAGVGVVDQLPGSDGWPSRSRSPQRHPQRRQHQLGALVGRGVPGDDPLGEDVDDERDVDEPGPGPHVGEVGDPDPVRVPGR